MKRVSTVLGVVAFLVVAMAGVPQAKADTCVVGRVVIIDYLGWPIIGHPGYYQCEAPIGPPFPPTLEEVIGQRIIYCDGSEYTWGQNCDPGGRISYGDYCDCGPDQPNSARTVTKAEAARAAQEATTFHLR